MSDEVALVPTEIRTVEFYGDQITGALVQIADDARIYVPIRPICEYLGLGWGSQYNRIKRDEVLNAELRGVFIMKTPQGGTQETLCLPLELLPGFLFGLTPGKVRPELQEKIIRYRRECYRRLWDTFKSDILQSAVIAPSAQPGGAALAYELATAVQNLAREQMQLEARQVQHEGRLNAAAQWAKGIDTRVSALELRMLPDQQISTSQAGELALQVKTVAAALEQQGKTNGYQRVYGELYRRFNIASYKSLPQSRFDEALVWLRSWFEEIEAGTV